MIGLSWRSSANTKANEQLCEKSSSVAPALASMAVPFQTNLFSVAWAACSNVSWPRAKLVHAPHMMGSLSGVDMEIRGFSPDDAAAVRELFIRVNRLLAPADMREAFEIYIVRSLTEEIDRVSDYYSERKGDFWVAVDDQKIVGMFGLEPSSDGAMELRRMYVDPDLRRRGIARKMLDFAEQECRRRNRPRMDLSTSEFQREALALYQNAGYERVREEVAAVASNKALGGGIRRYHFTKALLPARSMAPLIHADRH
jgi:GNAT superfamily N-acetyltransferase